jgi:hypothetical protein
MSDTNQTPAADNGANAPTTSPLDSEEAPLAGWFDGLSKGLKWTVAIVIIVVIAVVLGIWHDFYFHWFEVHTGTVNETGPYYGFWSGFGSDIGEATLVVGVVAVWRHHNCHVKGCARLGRHVEGTPYVACPKHHPDHKGAKRSISLEELHLAHRKAHEAPQ